MYDPSFLSPEADESVALAMALWQGPLPGDLLFAGGAEWAPLGRLSELKHCSPVSLFHAEVKKRQRNNLNIC